MEPILITGIIVFTGFIFGELCTRIRLPKVTGYIAEFAFLFVAAVFALLGPLIVSQPKLGLLSFFIPRLWGLQHLMIFWV